MLKQQQDADGGTMEGALRALELHGEKWKKQAQDAREAADRLATQFCDESANAPDYFCQAGYHDALAYLIDTTST